MKCPKCGQPLPSDSEFCQYCGEVISSTAEEIAAPVVSTPEPAAMPTEDPSIPVDTAPPRVKKPAKNSYCKRCGGFIDPETKKCTSCEKQYFHLPKLHLPNKMAGKGVVVAALLLACLNAVQLGLNLHFSKQLSELDAEYQAKCVAYEDEKTKAHALRQEYIDYRVEAAEKINFYDDNIVFICSNDLDVFHKYDCESFDPTLFVAYNKGYAEYLGYIPCYKCGYDILRG